MVSIIFQKLIKLPICIMSIPNNRVNKYNSTVNKRQMFCVHSNQTWFCLLAMCMVTSDILEVSGHVGENVSIPCFGSWTAHDSENISMYFCKGICSRENTIIQTNQKWPALPQWKHSIEVSGGDGVLTVSIKRLRRADAGRYLCGVTRSSNVSYQEVTLKVVDGKFFG